MTSNFLRDAACKSSESSENIDSSRYALLKKAKKREYLTLAQFQAFQRGETPDLAVDSKDHIFVLDPEKKQVRVFALKTKK